MPRAELMSVPRLEIERELAGTVYQLCESGGLNIDESFDSGRFCVKCLEFESGPETEALIFPKEENKFMIFYKQPLAIHNS